MHNKKLKIFGIVVLFIVLGFVYLMWWQKSRMPQDMIWIDEIPIAVENQEIITDKSENSGNIEETGSMFLADDGSKTTKAVIYVYVCGFVKEPAVYELTEGSRVFQAVEMAGGVSEDGNVQYLNMAGILMDGERIYVPSNEEAESLAEENVSGNAKEHGLVNINMASKEQLMSLPGIGESKADAIIQYREQNGGFASIEDIMQIPGIKNAAFSKIKDLICT